MIRLPNRTNTTVVSFGPTLLLEFPSQSPQSVMFMFADIIGVLVCKNTYFTGIFACEVSNISYRPSNKA
jgi:hypothetical protein